jgi:hypothetical protein
LRRLFRLAVCTLMLSALPAMAAVDAADGSVDDPIELEVSSGGVHESIPLQDFNVMPYVQRVQELVAKYPTGAPDSEILERNKRLRQLFGPVLQNREFPRWRVHQFFQQKTLKCKNSRSGGHKSCPGNITWSTDYKVLSESVADSRRHFHRRAEIVEPNVVSWNFRRTGKGTNTGWVKATAHFTDAAIKAGIQSDRVRLRRALEMRNLPTDEAIDPKPNS